MKVVDMHAHLWLSNYEKNKSDILKGIEDYNIDMVFVSGLVSYMPDKDSVEKVNNEVYKFAKGNPNHIKAYTYISPEHNNALDMMMRGIEDNGAIGTKIWVSEKCDAMTINPIAEKSIEYDLPILIHAFKKSMGEVANESTAVNVRNLALRYPKLKIIMAHVGGNAYHAIPLIKDLKNVWVDISGTDFHGDFLPYTLENIGAKRIMFGSDGAGAYLTTLGQVLDADMTDCESEQILYKNAKALFNL